MWYLFFFQSPSGSAATTRGITVLYIQSTTMEGRVKSGREPRRQGPSTWIDLERHKNPRFDNSTHYLCILSFYQVSVFSFQFFMYFVLEQGFCSSINYFFPFSNSYRSVTFHYRFQKTHSICPLDPSIHQDNFWGYSTHYLCILFLYQVSVFSLHLLIFSLFSN